MRSIKLIAVTLLLLGYICSARACQCGPYYNIFYELNYSRQDNDLYGQHIIMGVVGNTLNGYGFSVHVLNVYYGVNNLPDTIKIWGDPIGNSCRFNPVGYYHVGDTMIAMIDSLQYEWGVLQPNESLSDYAISACYFDFMILRNDSVLGGGSYDHWNNPSLSDFLDSLNRILNAPILGIQNIAGSMGGIIYPNPARQDITLQLPAIHTMAQVRVCDMNGRLILQQVLPFVSGKAKLHIDVPPGIYTLQLTDEDGFTKTEKLVIDR
ncbi:MAG: T9SS type A sorting domain-containing protein [Flavipsychrobacter sp.]|nr:T9SS type A sorting domain-containing protein [Flavipsychrobacter sp.]